MRFRLAVAFTLIDLLVSAGFSVAGVLAPRLVYAPAQHGGRTVLVFALYAAARSIPLALAVSITAVRRAWRATSAFGAVGGVIQACDAAIGIVGGSPFKIIGPLATAILQIWACRVINDAAG